MSDPWDEPLPPDDPPGLVPSPTLMEDTTDILNMLISRATDRNEVDAAKYHKMRERLVAQLGLQKLPEILKKCRDVDQIWPLVCRPKFHQWQERRDFLREQFEPLLAVLEIGPSPVDEAAENMIKTMNSDHIEQTWRKAMERRSSDPEGAITMARTLLESVCKHVLDDLTVRYEDRLELPQLYKLTSKNLNLAPEQHSEQVFKTILSGCNNVVSGLGSLRNGISDSHGRGRKAPKVAPRHAALAVNLAGSMASFLFSTLQERQNASTL